MEGVYSSHQIAKALRENAHFTWLSGRNRLDFGTINRFRDQVITAVIGDVFRALVKLLIEQRHVKLENHFLDRTKMETNANRHPLVCPKNTKRDKRKTAVENSGITGRDRGGPPG